MNGLKGSVGGSTRAITGLESELRTCSRDKTLQRRPPGLHGGLESDSEPGCAALDNVEELHSQGGSGSAVWGVLSDRVGRGGASRARRATKPWAIRGLDNPERRRGSLMGSVGLLGVLGNARMRRVGSQGRGSGGRGSTVSSDSPQSGEGSWCGGAGLGWLQGRWPAGGGQ